MSGRAIALHHFCSVLLDCDLTGTSLADDPRVRAPRVSECAEGTPL